MMMLEKNKMTIVIEEFSIEEQWVDTVKELLDLLYCKDDDFTQNHRNVLLLLENMMPDYEQVKAMVGVMPEEKE